MDLLIIGKENCSRCDMTKNILNQKTIPFTYKLLDELEESKRKELLLQARIKGLMNMPLIIKDDHLVELKEVIG